MEKFYKENKPATSYSKRKKLWYINGKKEGLSIIEQANGSKEWYINTKLHRENGPAIELADGSKYWYINGQLHREDGPAVELADGSKEWYINRRFIKTEK